MCEKTGWSQGMQDEVWYFWVCQHLRQSSLWAVSSASVLPWHHWAPALSFTQTHSQSLIIHLRLTHTQHYMILNSLCKKKKMMQVHTERERDIQAASESLGSWLALLPHQASTFQAAFVHEGTSQNWFWTYLWGSMMV